MLTYQQIMITNMGHPYLIRIKPLNACGGMILEMVYKLDVRNYYVWVDSCGWTLYPRLIASVE